MSFAGKLELKLKAQEFRRAGLSMKEIQRRLGISRSSVSLWTRDIKLTREQLEKLYLNKKTGALRGSIIVAMNKIYGGVASGVLRNPKRENYMQSIYPR